MNDRIRALPLAEAVCLALVCEGAQHGWSLVRELAPGGPVGRVWSLSRPLTYRAIDQLVGAGLVVRKAAEPGAGANRQPLAVTAAGRRLAAEWLAAPVDHLRDVRTELLVKLVLCGRTGVDPYDLLVAQRAHFAPLFARRRAGLEHGDSDVVDRWRAASSESVERFLDAEIRRVAPR